MLGETANSLLGSEVQHLIDVPRGEDFLAGAAVPARGAVLAEDEEDGAGITRVSRVLTGRGAHGGNMMSSSRSEPAAI
ncbi:hypothetical protein [Streptomyces sp. NPDC006875]|uniref:hypothetical protein n=1 Tax=Streptomyces sp. NPDC006875 TaxID=3154781 RepID=UPI001360A777|nr:hypothetical protein EAO69_14870 [Streptomyces sp. me109]